VVPFLIDLIHPRSVLDVGCGLGGWLAEFQRLGVEGVLGVDGDYVDREALHISQFEAHDLEKPLDLGREFDLALCLEVAEHLPPDAGESLVASLVRHAPVVVFSAAVPGQGGNGHIHLRWPDYWAGLFDEYGYAACDCLRMRLWRDERVRWFYAQNTVAYVRRDQLDEFPGLSHLEPVRLVHERLYESVRRRRLKLFR
jgi:SAM-dependent methyltransferase